jgi:hypothetical protein
LNIWLEKKKGKLFCLSPTTRCKWESYVF